MVGDMKRRIGLLLAVACTLMQGCIIYPLDKTPPCDGVGESMRAGLSRRPRCLLSSHLRFKGRDMGMSWREGHWDRDHVLGYLGKSGLFQACLEDSGKKPGRDDVRVDVTLEMDFNVLQNFLCSFLTGFTFLIVPFPVDNDYTYRFQVSDATGKAGNYVFTETLRGHIGIPVLLFMGSNDSLESTAKRKMNEKILNNLMVRMAKDGFFVDTYRDSLDALLKSGIITEEEYAEELRKGAK